MIEQVMLGIVVVNYRTVEQTVLFVREQLSKVSVSKKIVIVNVACDEKINRALSKKLDACLLDHQYAISETTADVYILPHSDNLGYAKGNNLGAHFLLEHFNVTYLLISNNDIIVGEHVVEKMIHKIAELDQRCGVIGPKVVGLDGRVQSPHRYFSFFKFIVSKLFYPIVQILNKYRIISWRWGVVSNAEEGYYYRLSGCFFLFDSEAFLAINGFDEWTFLYSEEAIVAERLQKRGYGCYYLPNVQVIHAHSYTTRNFAKRSKMEREMFKSCFYYYKTYRELSNSTILFGRGTVFIACLLYDPLHWLKSKMKK